MEFMKRLILGLLTACTITAPVFGGVEVVKEYKEPVLEKPRCFKPQELQLDLFYSYNDARPGTHRYFRDGSGGGVGINYFFGCYFGISVEGNWWDGTQVAQFERVRERGSVTRRKDDCDKEGRGKDRFRRRFKDNDRSVAHQVTGNFILRYPVELCDFCFAPYIFGGGGGLFDGEKVGFGDAGVGIEWRATEHLGLFADWRWIFTGKGKNDIDTTRAGVRFVF
jgi:hypothetical protein